MLRKKKTKEITNYMPKLSIRKNKQKNPKRTNKQLTNIRAEIYAPERFYGAFWDNWIKTRKGINKTMLPVRKRSTTTGPVEDRRIKNPMENFIIYLFEKSVNFVSINVKNMQYKH